MIELNKEYSTLELREVLNIKKSSWDRHREEILDYMKSFFNYKQSYIGNKVIYVIFEQYQDWVPYKKRDVEKQKAYYTEKTDQIISIQPRNTGSNIARIIDKNNMNIYNHKESTIGNYVRPILNLRYYAAKESRTWCEYDKETLTYIPLDKEQLEYLYSYFKVDDKAIFDIVADYRAGTITQEELGFEIEMLNRCPYDYAVNKFMDKYGFRPIKVPLWKDKSEMEEF